MNVVVNGDETTLSAGATVADVVASLGRAPSSLGVAVAVNGEVVPRAEWSSTQVSDRDRIEVLSAAQGG